MRRITDLELDQVLQEHQLWLETGGREGARADLRGADMQGADLQYWDLRRADLRRADLREVSLREVSLRRADLRKAELRKADLQGANLWRADLRGATLDVNIRNCWSFLGAKFTADALPWLILHPKWAEMQKTVRIEEATE